MEIPAFFPFLEIGKLGFECFQGVRSFHFWKLFGEMENAD